MVYLQDEQAAVLYVLARFYLTGPMQVTGNSHRACLYMTKNYFQTFMVAASTLQILDSVTHTFAVAAS